MDFINKIISELNKNGGVRVRLAILNYRIGFIEYFIAENKNKKILLMIIYKLLKIISFVLGCDEIPPKTAFIDWGLRLPHGFKGIEISYRAKIGKNCTLFHNTTIGTIECTGKYPVIGDNVSIGAHCLIIGSTYIGDNCNIGAGTRILNKSIENDSTIVNPIEYRIISHKI